MFKKNVIVEPVLITNEGKLCLDSTMLEVGDYVRIKGFKNEGKIVEILNDYECMVEWNDVKMMENLVCGTLYFEFLEKIDRGEANSTHLKAIKMIELEKID